VVAASVVLAGLAVGGTSAFAASSAAPSHSGTSKHQGKHQFKRHALRGVHGEATVTRKNGKVIQGEWQRGQVTGISGTALTVKSKDGTTWTWTVSGSTPVKRNGKKIAESALKTGDKVLVVGMKNGSANNAKRVLSPVKSAAKAAKAANAT
jgi:hypothetical protein